MSLFRRWRRRNHDSLMDSLGVARNREHGRLHAPQITDCDKRLGGDNLLAKVSKQFCIFSTLIGGHGGILP